MDEAKRQDEAPAEPELQRPDEAIKDLEPDEALAEAVKGGLGGQIKVIDTN
jgi:hypothetical protein